MLVDPHVTAFGSLQVAGQTIPVSLVQHRSNESTADTLAAVVGVNADQRQVPVAVRHVLLMSFLELLRSGHEPAERSFAEYGGSNAMGAIMTGMGNDGAEALGRIRAEGGFTIAQDEKTCVVFGMPKEAIRMDSVDEIRPLDEIAQRIVDFGAGKHRARKQAG